MEAGGWGGGVYYSVGEELVPQCTLQYSIMVILYIKQPLLKMGFKKVIYPAAEFIDP
jgi:hypothetical protein